jgi:hypothetical protein
MCPASDKMSSSPAEHYGAIGVLLVLIVLLHHFDALETKLPSMVLLIDNEEVVNRGNRLKPLFLNVGRYLTHDFDLWNLLSHLQSHLNLVIHFEWIKGHQDVVDSSSSNLFVDLNIQVDSLATEIYKEDLPIPQRGFYHSGVVCFHQEGFHVQNINNAIASRESDGRLLAYYKSKGWTEDSLLYVDWIAMEKFLLTLSPIVRCNTIQLMHNWQNTGYQKLQFHNAIHKDVDPSSLESDNNTALRDSRCPLGCGRLEEPFHYMQCTTDTMFAAREKGLSTLREGLEKLKTAPTLIEAIVAGIHCWTYDTEYDLTEESNPLLFDYQHTVLLQQQQQIGWDNFMKGYLSKKWRYIQGSYYKFRKLNKRKYHKDRWILQLLILLQQYRHDLWMLRNASLHGGFDKLHGTLLKTRLLDEVKYYYSRNRDGLSLSDKDMFKLPLAYRRKQGNQQLMLWVKRAALAFELVEENISHQQQLSITDWLTDWTDGTFENTSSSSTATTDIGGPVKRQSDLLDWINLQDGQTRTSACSNTTSNSFLPHTLLDEDTDGCSIEENREIVTDGLHQCHTTNTCILVT